MTRIKSLRRKFVQTLLLVSVLITIPTLAVVTTMSVQSSASHLTATEKHIERGIVSKGTVLTRNHALALRGLTLDNAFTDMQSLVGRAVKEDPDLVYGIYVDSEGATLAFCQQGKTCDAEHTPDKNTWSRLGLNRQSLLVDKEAVRRAVVLGEDVFEVSVPVAGETPQDPALGTIRYGLSTRRMTGAIQSAKLESETALKNSLTLLISCIALATVIGLFLSRKQAVKITRPVQDLTVAAMQLAKGNRTAKVEIDSGDELQQLGLSFNIMVDQLQASYGELEEMNRTLEQRVQERTGELAAKNRDMRLVLDNVNEGFITLSAEGVMASERSRVVDEWFGPGMAGDTLWAFWSRVSRPFAVEFRLAWEQLKDGMLPLSLCLSQLPDRLSHDGRTWSMTYLPFGTDDRFEGMLVVIADITEKLAHEREESAQQELMQSFKRLMLDRSGFTAFLNEGTEMVNKIRSGGWAPDSVEMKRTLHTLKGNTALMGLGFVAKICHNLEDHLEYSGEISPQLLEQLDERWNTIRGHVNNFVGDDSRRMVEIPAAEYSLLIAKFSNTADKQALVHQLLKWQLEPVSRYFDRMAEQARALALRLGKGNITVHLDGGNIRVDGERWASLFSELTHVVRNAVDHGLEEMIERKAAGKPKSGTIIFKAYTRNDRLVFEIKDDGRGIAWDSVREKAKQLGLPHATHADLVDALCYDGLSTREAATQISGRGVGMAALKTQVLERHGRIEATSTAGVGTTISLSFPLSHKSDVLVDVPAPVEAPISRAGNG